ncbi:hypothetical protein FOL47_006327, partial [Perkinsus chesapeaki]
CLYLRLEGRNQPGVLYRLLRLGFGQSSAPRILKCVLDYALGPDKSSIDSPLPLPSLSGDTLSRSPQLLADQSEYHEPDSGDSVPQHYKYFDDILVPEGDKSPPGQVYRDVEVIRAVLAKNGLFTKDPAILDQARLLGLQVFRGADD